MITNETTDTVYIAFKPTIHFSTNKPQYKFTSDGFLNYKMSPQEQVQFGSAIAEIDNDIPFEVIQIARSNDTITASTLEEIKSLFDKKSIGGLQKPYNLTIK